MPVTANPTREQFGVVVNKSGCERSPYPDRQAQFDYWVKPNAFGQSVQEQIQNKVGPVLFLG